LALLLVVPACALFSACSLAPTYQRPTVAVPATLGEHTVTAVATAGATPAASATLSLEEARFLGAFAPDAEATRLVTAALAANPDLRSAASRVAEARAGVAGQRAALFPQLGATVQRDRSHMDDPTAAAMLDRDFTSATLDLRFDPDFFGRLRSLSDAASYDYLASEAGQKEARGELIAAVLAAYVDERAADEVADKLVHADRAGETLAGHARTQYTVGTISADDLQERLDQVSRVHATRLDAQRRHDEALRYLQSLAGYAVAEPAVGLECIGRVDTAAGSLAALPSSVLLQRPDVVRAEERLRAANANIGAARAAFFPSIQLSSSVGHVSPSLDRLFGSATGGWTFLPQLTLPLFDGGARRAELDLAKARKDTAVADYEATVQRAFRDVADALGARDALTARVQSLDTACAAGDLRLAKAYARHQQGLEDASQVLARTIDTAQAQIDCLSARRDQALNRVAVFRAFYGVTLPDTSGTPTFSGASL
jgi:multidrug efflux system outer membrane protein